MAYESVILEGMTTFLEGKAKQKGLEIIALRYPDTKGGPYPAEKITNLSVIEVAIISCTGRRSVTISP
ncbi:MAG: hypothetical protein GXY48_06850 [Methanomicrobiales archaeon]|nr:hypothetical protein [Methanomicrobiales archaeon]